MEFHKIEHEPENICAISTPPGIGGIAVIRISGPSAIETVEKIWKGKKLTTVASHTAHLGYIINHSNEDVIDQCIATVYKAPSTFTGETIVELSLHGSQWIQQETLQLLLDTGACRIAQPGEFTRKAFANGKIDLSQAEAIADIISSTTRASHRLAITQLQGKYSSQIEVLRQSLVELASLLELELDFSEEDVEFASRKKLVDIANKTHLTISQMADTYTTGKAIKEGIPIAIVGEPNAGKSTLLNQLSGENRAIVSNIPGTTRDTIENTITLNGIQYRLIDTAGIRHTTDAIENLGIERSIEAISKASIVILLTTPETTTSQFNTMAKQIMQSNHVDTKIIICHNKTDLSTNTNRLKNDILLPQADIQISALNGTGIDLLKETLEQLSTADCLTQPHMVVTNARHYQALSLAKQSIQRVIEGLQNGLSGDFIAQDLRQTLHHLGEITGAITTPDILSTIFSRFCIGK
ncbi:MAG: tRNA uridine-5-carboxymethylaminomethyl(34) synthesis GTPase MnmE [Muribaculaceae bacterium]|nr:tRNA uridine-5-carboxymethylaminomethyl(34) synthesis GTPase MnmE [Muribaculaceae bacterium]